MERPAFRFDRVQPLEESTSPSGDASPPKPAPLQPPAPPADDRKDGQPTSPRSPHGRSKVEGMKNLFRVFTIGGNDGTASGGMRRCSIEESCRGDVENMGEARLCLPTVRGTFLCSLLSSSFIFIGLLALSAAELGIHGLPRLDWLALILRFVGWGFLFYIPIHFMSVPFLRNFLLWSLQPGERIREAFAYGYGEDSGKCAGRRAALFPYCVHTCWLAVYAILVFVDVGDEGHFGLVPIFGVGNLFMIPVGSVASLLLAPPLVSKSYAFKIGPSTILFPIVGFLVVVANYIILRRLIGPSLGFVMPLLLSAYELLGTSLVSRVFTREFVTQREVREGYLGTNQGIVVSMAICNLHAMAEGARLTLLYVDNLEGNDWDILVPVISGVCWNVMVRLGALDRFLHIVTNGWRKPNNGSKLLREAGYCMGYPRFGAVCALMLARLCIGTPMPLDGPELRLLVVVLVAEICEDLASFVLRYIGVNMFPRSKLVTEQEVQEMAEERLSSRRRGSKERATRTDTKDSSGRKASKDSALPTTAATEKTGSLSIIPSGTAAESEKDKDQSDLTNSVSDRKLMKTTCWRVRVAYDFRFRIEAFDEMPFWAHLLPTAMAQFHTIFAMVVFSGGLDFILGLCDQMDLSDLSSAVLWWPMRDTQQLCQV